MHVLRYERAAELIDQFSSKRLLVIGDIMLDRYVTGKVERLNPEAPVPILHAKSERLATGGAGNAAKNAAALSARSTLISVAGADVAASRIAAAAEREGYRAVLVSDAGRPTIEKKRYIVSGQQMLRVDHEETHDIPEPVERQVIDAVEKEAPFTDGIIVSDYAKGLLTRAVAKTVMLASRAYGFPVMADVKPAHIRDFTGTTYISPNWKEAQQYIGLNQYLPGGHTYEHLAASLHQVFQTNVFLTLSEDGIYVYGAHTRGIHVPQCHRVEVADTSGCGDTAAVVLTLAKLCGATDIEAAQIANAAGAIIASKIGAVAITVQELRDVLLQAETRNTSAVDSKDTRADRQTFPTKPIVSTS